MQATKENNLIMEIPDNVENLQLPDPDLLEYYRGLNDRIIWIDFELDPTLLEVTKSILRFNKEDNEKGIDAKNRKPIKLLIYTPGGDARAVLNLIDIIDLSVTPIYTYNMGIALSGGFEILVSGHKRYTLKRSLAMVHSGSGQVMGTYEQTKAQMDEYDRLQKIFEENLKLRTKISDALFEKNKSRDWYMDSQKQLKLGVVDGIITNINDLL